jgi:hypothetical protein
MSGFEIQITPAHVELIDDLSVISYPVLPPKQPTEIVSAEGAQE